MNPKEQQEFTALDDTRPFSGTDIYLTLVSAFISSAIVHHGFFSIMSTYNIIFNPNFVYTMMAITSLLSSHNCLTMRNRYNNRFYRKHVWDSVSASLQVVFISPFTIFAQIGQSLFSGIVITRNLFD